MNRRKLDFRSIDEIVADLEKLQAEGYTKIGNWSLGQICQHCAIFVRGSMDGFADAPKPGFFMRLMMPVALWWMLRTRKMPTGVNIPDQFRPSGFVDDGDGVREYTEALRRFEKHPGPMQPSPFADTPDRETWHQIHLVHATHHLSFLQPAPSAAEASSP